MELSQTITEMLLHADAKALGTVSSAGLVNVVPVSSMSIVDNKIVLVNYFMGKTLENILGNNQVALSCWKGLSGYQIKGTIDYQTGGTIFDGVKQNIAETLPDRVVLGVLILSPQEIYDISAGENAGKRI